MAKRSMIPQKLTVLFVYSALGRVLVEPYGLSAPIINGGIFGLYFAILNRHSISVFRRALFRNSRSAFGSLIAPPDAVR
jgi:hypothetical protein